MVENPFVFGKIVKGRYFCDREAEMEQVRKITESKQHIIIISPRRYGKTSLIINALELSKTPYIYADCSFIENEKYLFESILNDYVKKIDRIDVVNKLLKRIDVSFSLNLNPLSVEVREIKTDSLRNLLTEIGRRYVIVFDEFQDLYDKNKKMVNKIRSVIQFIEKSVVMLGSKRHILNNMFLKPRGIFYNFGYALHLEKIEREKFKKFIMFHFLKSGLTIKSEEVERLLDVTENHPFYTQYFSHFLFEKKLAVEASVDDVLNEILNINSTFYEETFFSLSSNQKKALLLLSHGGKKIYSGSLLKKFGISSSQALQKALNSLVKKEIIDRNGDYHILDVFLKHWLARRA